MSKSTISGGLVHELPNDLKTTIMQSEENIRLWEKISVIGRNEYICWVENAKQDKTRQRRVRRSIEELHEGKTRPCCWVGCIHRTDKKPSKWQQAFLIDKKPNTKA